MEDKKQQHSFSTAEQSNKEHAYDDIRTDIYLVWLDTRAFL